MLQPMRTQFSRTLVLTVSAVTLTACQGDSSTTDDLETSTISSTESSTDTSSSTDDDTGTDSGADPGCGDGILDPDEACDDGNFVDDDGCTNACALPICGGDIVQDDEAAPRTYERGKKSEPGSERWKHRSENAAFA